MVPILIVVLPLSIDPHFMVSEDVQQLVNQGDNCETNAERTEIKLYAMHTFQWPIKQYPESWLHVYLNTHSAAMVYISR